jgi:hypothetical protein
MAEIEIRCGLVEQQQAGAMRRFPACELNQHPGEMGALLLAPRQCGDDALGPEAPAGATQGPPYAYFPTSSCNLVHLYLGYQINPDALASFSVENLFNQQYSRYLDVSPNPNHGLNSTPLPFFSPGITIKGALTVRFSDLTLFGG